MIPKSTFEYFTNYPIYIFNLGGQTAGPPRGGRSGLAAAQVRVLHEGHRTHVPLPVPRAHHPVPGHALPQGAEQGDDKRRRLLDHHLHRQGRVPVLRGHGPGPFAGHPRPHRAQPAPERGRRRGHAGVDRRQLLAVAAGVVRRRGGRNHVPLSGEHAVRGAGHLAVQGRVAVDQTADAGARLAGAQRRHHLRDGADVHVHPGAGAEAALRTGRRDYAAGTAQRCRCAGAVAGGHGGRGGGVELARYALALRVRRLLTFRRRTGLRNVSLLAATCRFCLLKQIRVMNIEFWIRHRKIRIKIL